MKAVVARAPGGPEVLELTDYPDPVAGAGEVVIRTRTIAVESGDLLMRRYFQSTGSPAPLGYASVGDIVAIGEGVSAAMIGKPVLTFGFDGAYAEYRSVPQTHCFPLPENMDPCLAVAGFIGPSTAALAADLGGVRAGETVVVLGGSGGVGFAAMQIVRNLSARPIATVRSAASRRALGEQGFEAVFVDSETDVAKALAAAAKGMDAAVLIDTIGGDALPAALGAIADGGRVVIVGITGPGEQVVSTASILTRRLTVRGCFLGTTIARPEIRAMIAETLIAVRDGRIAVPIQQIFPLEAAIDAHIRAETPSSLGKVVMTL